MKKVSRLLVLIIVFMSNVMIFEVLNSQALENYEPTKLSFSIEGFSGETVIIEGGKRALKFGEFRKLIFEGLEIEVLSKKIGENGLISTKNFGEIKIGIDGYGKAQFYLRPSQEQKFIEYSGKIKNEKSATVNSGALIKAAHYGKISKILSLIEGGADVNVRGSTGVTPLYVASMRGHLDVIKLLLDKGADVNIRDDRGGTALVIATEKGYIDIMELLINSGANVNVIGTGPFQGVTAAYMACQEGQLEALQLLLDNNADFKITIKRGTTCLMAASHNGHIKLVKLLLSKGANVNAKDDLGRSVLEYAKATNQNEIVQILKQAGAK